LFHVYLNTQVLKGDSFILWRPKIEITGVHLNARLDRPIYTKFGMLISWKKEEILERWKLQSKLPGFESQRGQFL
jgi:hypothetical protein